MTTYRCSNCGTIRHCDYNIDGMPHIGCAQWGVWRRVRECLSQATTAMLREARAKYEKEQNGRTT